MLGLAEFQQMPSELNAGIIISSLVYVWFVGAAMCN